MLCIVSSCEFYLCTSLDYCHTDSSQDKAAWGEEVFMEEDILFLSHDCLSKVSNNYKCHHDNSTDYSVQKLNYFNNDNVM